MPQLFILILGGVGGAITTFFLQKNGLSVVISSCLVGLAGALLGKLTDSSHVSLIIFAGSFVGMASSSFGTLPLMILGGIAAGVIYHFSLNIFTGFGGRLGTIAFISTVLSYYLLLVVKRFLG